MLKENKIEMLKDKLLEKKEQLMSETALSKNIIQGLHSESSSDELDYAEISSDSYNLNILMKKQLHHLHDIDISLNKIEKKTYGICEMCDGTISYGRLKVKPHATFCIECREAYEKELNNH